MALTGQRIARVDLALLVFYSISISIVGVEMEPESASEDFLILLSGGGGRHFSIPKWWKKGGWKKTLLGGVSFVRFSSPSILFTLRTAASSD